MLTDAQLATLRQDLEKARTRIIGNAETAVNFSRDRDRDRTGRDSLDESTEEWLYATTLRLHDREKFLLSKIDQALARIAEGTVDQCEDCDEPIGYARLSARPVTTLCVLCKEDRESRES